MIKKILVTGGAGYIGSNVVDFIFSKNPGVKIYVLDNLSTGHKRLVHPKAVFIKADLTDCKKLLPIFKKIKPDIVFHFGGLSQVGESNKKPEKYFRNNILGGSSLLKAMNACGCKKIIFSSSASVYGIPKKKSITETHSLNPISVYGQTKMAFEKYLDLFGKFFGFKFLSLRYFNAGGASSNYKCGEIHIPETHLIPNILQSIKENKILEVYGNDYKTKDGTCVRDYIHVTDIANAHFLGMKYLEKENSKSQFVNLGSGKGFSVMEIINKCERITKIKARIKITQKRPGDPPVLIASKTKAKRILGWQPRKSIDEIVKSAWQFIQQ